MKKIPLTQGRFILVDNDRFEYLNSFHWVASIGGYAQTQRMKNKVISRIRMHRMIMNAKKGERVDHINGNRLDNRVSNLRLCTNAENVRNSKIRSNNTTGYKGVYQHKSKSFNKFEAYIWVDYKKIILGYFKNKIDAAKAYNKGALKYHKEFAHLNVI